MGLRLEIDGERVRGRVELDRRHEGAPGFAHGGAIATILDDALGSLLILLKVPAVTVNLSVDYRRPAFIGRTFAVEAWVERREQRKLYFAGVLKEGDVVIAEAHGLFLQVEAVHFLKGAEELPHQWSSPEERERWLPW